jgi:hypothetical protein
MPTKTTYSQAARVQGILRTLGTRHGITIGELSEESGVTKRTLYRDLKALAEAGYCQIERNWLFRFDRFADPVLSIVPVLALVHNHRIVLPLSSIKAVEANLSQMRTGISDPFIRVMEIGISDPILAFLAANSMQGNIKPKTHK